MDQTFKISFVIAVYNPDVALLQECLKSILTLSVDAAEREIIVVDDGSESNLIEQLGDSAKNILYVRQSHLGVSDARNVGLRMATGSHIQFIDGDDRLVKEPYEHCVGIARNQEADIVFFQQARSEQEKSGDYADSKAEDGSMFMLHRNLRGSACGYLFRKRILSSLEFPIGIRYGEDEVFTPQLVLRADQVVETSAQAYYYRQNPASVTHQRDAQHVAQRLDDSLQVILRLQELASTGTESNREALQRRIAQLTMDYLYNIMRLTRSYSQLELQVSDLYGKGLFPLPDRDYTSKYKWFRKITNSNHGRRMLCALLSTRWS